MKMKSKYVYQLGAFILGIFIISGCVEWPEFEPLDLASAPTVTVEQTNVSDSTITVNVTSTANGFVSAVLLEGAGNPVPADSGAILQGNVDYLDYASGEVEAGTAVSITFSTDIEQNSPYEVMAVAANEDGVVSAAAVVQVTTVDTYKPAFLGANPDFTYDPELGLTDTIMLSFNETVQLGTGGFTFETFFGGQMISVPSDSVMASGNMVTIYMPMMPDYGDYVWLHWEADAVTDFAGNGVDALTTVLDGQNFDGAYWRLVYDTATYVSTTPDFATETLDPGADLTITFADEVSASGYETGDMMLHYESMVNDSTISSTTIYVAAEHVSASGNDLIINQIHVATEDVVTLTIPAGILTVGPGRNPVYAIEETWTITP